jgi:hypothetical protein
MLFARGITGFNVPREAAQADPESFRADCHEVARILQGRVENRPQVLEGSVTSFLTQVLLLPAGPVTALLNKFHPLLAFCEPLEPGDCWLRFVDCAAAESFATLGRFSVLAAEELNQPVVESMCGELGRAEREQLKYWSKLAGRGKLRVGEVIFNFWD